MIRIILPIFLLSASFACAQLIVDPGPGVESLRSKIYEVSVTGDGGAGGSYVYQSENNADFNMFPPGTFMATANHWTSFCFDGSATVRIRKRDGSTPRTVRIRPASAGIQAEIIGREIVLKLDRPRQLSVEIDAPDELIPQPLLIFANPPEKILPALRKAGITPKRAFRPPTGKPR
jgi:hypothetical protein